MKRFLVMACMAGILSGCATRPQHIPAAIVSHEQYMANDCAQLTASMVDARSRLEKLWTMQNNKADLDATSVAIAFIPASKLTGDHAKDVARYKGEVVAIGTALASKGCAVARTA